MARKGANSTQRMPPPPIVTTNGNANVPPPSTIAAQIVQNATHLNARQDAAAKVSFGELVKEFLQHPNTDEPDPQLVALICVIAEAGLDGLFKDDPFAEDQQRQQGIDSISALKVIIQKKPHLLISAKDADGEGSPQPPLFVWLFPKLLGLMTHITLQPLHQHAQELLGSCLEVLSRAPLLWRHATSLALLYRSSIQLIVSELEAVGDLTAPPTQPFRISIPSSSSIGEFWPESQQFVALPHELQRTITSQLGAIYVGLNTMLALVSGTQQQQNQRTGSASYEHHEAWFLDTCLRLWQDFRRWTTGADKRSFHDETMSLFLRVLEASVLPLGTTKSLPPASSKTAQSLVRCLLGILDRPDLSTANQVQFASLAIRLRSAREEPIAMTSFTGRRRTDSITLIADDFEGGISVVCQDEAKFGALHKDLQSALCLWTTPGAWPLAVAETRKKLCINESASFTDPQLLDQAKSVLKSFRGLNLGEEEDRPAKRRKTLPDSGKDVNISTYEHCKSILVGSDGQSSVSNLSDLHNMIQATYSSMPDDVTQSEKQQCELLSAFARIACAGSGSLKKTRVDTQNLTLSNCTVCNGPSSSNREGGLYWNEAVYGEDWKDAIAAMLVITKEPRFDQSPKARVYMALAIGRMFRHISDVDYLYLEACELGQWLATSMSRSLREHKLAATHSLMVFLRQDIARSIRQKNCRWTLEFLSVLAKRDVITDCEILITAYGLVARVCGELELPIVLQLLIEYFGHPNALICALASNELDTIASDRSTNALQLLQPYWRVIAFSVLRDVNTRPQKAQILADLTEQSVRQLLILTQADTLPHLVLTKRRDVIEKIAHARRATIGEVLTQPKRNLAKILALLLCQSGSDVEANAMESLATIEPAIREGCNNKLEALLTADITGVAVEILLLSSDQNEEKKKLYHRGFATLAMLVDVKPGQRKSTSKTKSLDGFFERHILGIVSHFTDIIESPLAQVKAMAHPLPERKRSIAAIGELVLLARHNVNGALPQFRACLQSAMADLDLIDDSFAVWSALLDPLSADDDNVMSVVDQTFALIVQHWPLFSEETQLKAHKTIIGLTQKFDAQLRARIQYLPSLESIPMMSKTVGEIVRLKTALVDTASLFHSFDTRCKDQNAVIVRQALKELVPFLDGNQKYLHQSVVSQKPLPVLGALTRSLLDASIRFAEDHQDITTLCAQCLGIIGGLDPHRVENVREKKRVLMLSNFSRRDEDIEFVFLLLEQVLVKVFLSTTNAKAQGWIAYVMQEMLKHCGFSTPLGTSPRSSQTSAEAQRWNEMPEPTRTVLTPFRSSRYSVNLNAGMQYKAPQYPIFTGSTSHNTWLQTFVYDLLQKGQGVNVEMVFPVLARVIRGYDLSIATFILPFAALNVIVSDDEQNMDNVGRELLTVLQTNIRSSNQSNAGLIKQCSENVFQTLDYLSMWLQEKRKAMAEARVMAGKTGRGISDDEEMNNIKQISRVEGILQGIPAEVISQRAVECGSYARALFHWEQYIRQQQLVKADARQSFSKKDEMLQHLQMIYAQIDEPDCIEGISAHLRVLNPEQQIIEDRKAGRLNAAQSWYEIALAEKPNDPETQINLLTCLKESGQHDSILNYVDGFRASNYLSSSTLPFAAEAAWSAGKWEQLERTLGSSTVSQDITLLDFNVGVGHALLALRRKNSSEFKKTVASLRGTLVTGLSPSTTASLQACHDHLVKLHALYEMEAISGMDSTKISDRDVILENLDRRLDIIGAYTSDKQYLLGLRRAAMSLSRIEFTNLDIAAAWLTTGRLARKGDFLTTAFNSVMHAEQLGDSASKIEYSKLLWKEGHHRKAIQHLRGAIESNAFEQETNIAINVSVTTTGEGTGDHSNKIKCHAQLLLAKWLDRSGQTKAAALKDEYHAGVMSFPRWDKCHYYLGRYYLKLLESEKRQPVSKQSSEYLSGSLLKLVVENWVRSTVYGTKYYYQTLPKVLTLWLDMGMEVLNTAPRTTRDKEFHDHRINYLDHINKHVKRYTLERMPPFAWYTAFPQIITRISHPNKNVWDALQTIIAHVASKYPQQSLWSLLAVLHSTQDDRRTRGVAVMQKLREPVKRKGGTIAAPVDLKNLIIQGQRLTDSLLAACDAPVEQRVARVSLSKNLGFSHKLAPSLLVVPIEANLLPNLPTGNNSGTLRKSNPFPQDTVTISAFMDEVLVLSSLQRPRKVDVRGSDGRMYGLLCKPKDDLRKDQRLMEFNAMINRALQKDIDSSKRRLYIKTYAVTPLNEECGAIEWVEGLKPMRDIIISSYRQHHISIDYTEIRLLLTEASSSPTKVPIFTDKILGKFKPVLHEWFVETFPEPEAWFSARLRYTRSCAVMSIVGHVLGLGDRHGENVLLEEGNGGTFHVDFNCLFDKGLTFEKPELVPFRLTHNMVDAMGPQGIEGPFRKAAELTYSLLRQHEDTLITILETFVHDPTADFLGGRKRKRINGVPDTPQEVLDMVRTKVNGYLKGESVPLSVEGYVEALIAMAKDPFNLASMYIGWCAFF